MTARGVERLPRNVTAFSFGEAAGGGEATQGDAVWVTAW